MLDAGHLHRVLQELLVLLLDVHRHRVEVVDLEALVRGGMLVLDVVMVLGFGHLIVVLPVVDVTGEAHGKQCHKDLRTTTTTTDIDNSREFTSHFVRHLLCVNHTSPFPLVAHLIPKITL